MGRMRTIGFLIAMTLLASGAAGYYGYWLSRRALESEIFESNLSLAHAVAVHLRSHGGADQRAELLDQVLEHWRQIPKRYPGTCFCAIKPDGEVLLHSMRPEWVGKNFGDLELDPPRGTGPGLPLREVAAVGGDWIGWISDGTGERKLAGVAYDPSLQLLVSVQVPETEVQASVKAAFLPAALGIATGAGLLLPLLLLALSRVYRATLRDRARTEEALREADARALAVLDTAVEAIVTIDEGSRIQGFNPAAEKLFGYSQRDVLGRRVEILIDPDVRDQHAGYIQRYLETGEARIIGIGREVMARHRDGTTFPVELSVAEVFVPGRRLFTGMIRDITRRKRAEAELEGYRNRLEELVEQRTGELAESTARLAHAERLASVGTLAAGIAHEINNPLGAILMAAEALEKRAEAAAELEPVRRQVELIRSETGRCARIVRSVLDFARREGSETSLCDLIAIIRRAGDHSLAVLENAGVALELELPDELPLVGLNATEIERVLVNLIANAIEASDPGASVRVSAEVVDESVQVGVHDSGHGMTPEQVRQAFDPFFTTRKSAGGTGLGLSIAHGIVRRHEGTLHIRSHPGHGTSVTMLLPLERPAPKQPEASG